MITYDIAIIGLGVIGAAAAKYLSQLGARVVAIGPGEPSDWQRHQGVFASHYDQGRITRIIDPDPIWARLAQRALANYGESEAASGIRFHVAAGMLRFSPDPSQPGDTLTQAAANGRALGVDFSELRQPELRQQLPFLQLPAPAVGLWERGGAGYINPRSLLQAQLTMAERSGAALLRQTVVKLVEQAGSISLQTDAGERITASKAIVCSGAWSSALLPQPLAVRLRAATILLGRLSRQEAARLATLPTLVGRLEADPTLAWIYALPPIVYPDGQTYLKIGGPLHQPHWFQSAAELTPWFQGAGDAAEAAALRRVLLTLLPDLRVESWHTRPCVVDHTATGYPYIDRIGERLYVATGGCGLAAKVSDELGRLGAQLAVQERWTNDLPADVFAARII